MLRVKIMAPALEALQARLTMLRSHLVTNMIMSHVETALTQTVLDLRAAAPIGHDSGGGFGMSLPIGDDKAGKLVDSFLMNAWTWTQGRAIGQIETTQPKKLHYLRVGTGLYGPYNQRIYPRTKKALYWPGAAHPVASIAGMRPNDFVTPLLTGIALVTLKNEMALARYDLQRALIGK